MIRRVIPTLFAAGVLSAAGIEWAGSRACQPCHAKIYQSYMQTPMAASSGSIGSGLIHESFEHAEFENERSGNRYRVRREGARYLLEADKALRPLAYFIGSGAAARSYAFQIDGFLFQAPVAYYTQRSKWDFAPGYRRYDQPFLTRPILPGCLLCHASGVQHQPLTQNGYGFPPFTEGGVSCERCHGPGGSHVAAMRAGRKSPMVNPAKLDAARRDSVCAQCHLTGEARVIRAGRTPESFSAGDRLADHVAVFVRSGGASALKVTSHVENLAQSSCKQASGDKLWCGTCHDPHIVPSAAQRVTWFRSKCLTCHTRQSCKVRGEDCVSCHMPRNPVTDAEHLVYTDHAIGRKKTIVSQSTSGLVPFANSTASDRDLGLAYAIVALRENNPEFRSRAFPLLRGKDDAEALTYLAELYNRNSDTEHAIPLYERAIRLDASQLTAPVSLGAIRMEQAITARLSSCGRMRYPRIRHWRLSGRILQSR